MTNDYSEQPYRGESEISGKSPKDSSVSFIRQFARVYSTTKGLEFSVLILN